jgi:IclR family mhp operon transcriptional activator
MRTERQSTIRSIERALTVLRVINQYRAASMGVIAEKSQIPYPTACRIVQTLISEGMIERQGTRRYRPTALVQSLSVGYQAEDELGEIARPYLANLTRQVHWPVYISCRVGMNMVVKESTDSLTSLTIARFPTGYTLPLLESSSGRAYLAFTPPQDRRLILDGALDKTAVAGGARAGVESFLTEVEEIRRRGYAAVARHSYTQNPGKTSAVSVPVMDGNRAIAALALCFFASTLAVPAAARAFVESMRSTAGEISAALSASRRSNAGPPRMSMLPSEAHL